MTSQKLRVGMVGVGGFGARRRDWMRETGLFDLVAVYDYNPEAMGHAAEEDGACPVPSYEELLVVDGLQAMIISSGARFHAEQAMAALYQGLHVFIEKPLASTMEEVRAILAAQRETGLVVGCGHCDHSSEAFSSTVKRLIDSGELGNLVTFEASTAHSGGFHIRPGDWRSSRERNPGGMLFQCEVHKLHELIYYFGPVRQIRSIMRYDLHETETADVAMCQVEFESGNSSPHYNFEYIIMKTLILQILLTILFGISLCNAQEFETWSSENGSSIEAKYVGLKWEQLYLENRQGERMKFPLLTLAKKDRERAVAQAIKAGHLAASRTWSSKSETTVVASYSHFENNQLTLVKADGTSLTLPLSALAEADLKEAVKLAVAADEMPDIGSGTIQEPKSEDQLATLADGKWKDFYAVYESPLYRVRILPNGQVFIDLLDKGEQVGPSIRNNFGASYRDLSKPKKEWHIRRSVLRIVESTKPAIYQGTAEIVIKGLLDDEISFALTLSMKPNELNLSFETKDPPNLKYPTICGYGIAFPESHTSPMGTKFPELKKALKGWTLKMWGPRIPPQTVQFWETIEKSRQQQVEKLEIVGPWGPRKLTVNCPPVKSGKEENFRVISVYPGRPIYNRFNIGIGYAGDGAKSEYNLKFE